MTALKILLIIKLVVQLGLLEAATDKAITLIPWIISAFLLIDLLALVVICFT